MIVADDFVVNDMVDVLRVIIPAGSGVYASAPITSGKRFFALQANSIHAGESSSPLDPAMITEHVIAPNIADARKFVHSLRKRFGYSVIDPSRLVVSGWAQDHYVALWGAIVSRYARIVVFSAGWEYSSGCTYEFLVALDSGIETVDAKFRPLKREDGISLIRRAHQFLRRRGVRAEFLEFRLQQLQGLRPVKNGKPEPSLAAVDRGTLCSLMIGCVSPPNAATFVCAPDHAEHGKSVEQVRGRAELVIDPSAFVPARWENAEVDKLWDETVETYVRELVLGPGYEYCAGCVAALCRAVKLRLDVVEPDGTTLAVPHAVALIRAAATDLDTRRIESSRLRELLDRLREVYRAS